MALVAKRLRGEFFDDYVARENEEFGRFVKRVKSGKIEPGDRYPPLTRFKNAREPLVICDKSTYLTDSEKIWNQIPFAGSTIIPLHSVSKAGLLENNGFGVEDIPKLIELAKDTGKVQFALGTNPLRFEGLDHFDDILSEFRPPTLRSISPAALADDREVKKVKDEFFTLASVNYFQYLAGTHNLRYEGVNALGAASDNRTQTYLHLKYLEMNDVVEQIQNELIDNPERADQLLMGYGMILEPIFGASRAHRNVSISRLKSFGLSEVAPHLQAEIIASNFDSPKYPVEIGKFLMKKIAPSASDYYACKLVIDKYNENDLYKLLASIDRGIQDQSLGSFVKDVSELEIVMDNVWKDARRISGSGKVIQGGISIALGLVGLGLASALNSPAYGASGLLSMLGLKVADKFIDGKNLGEKIAKLINKDYITNVYDFSEKYRITGKEP